ncbi:hypothetical protein [Streptomyces cinereoruber]|uniref:hypothetical protein n=1 Tax=Streptomyces cinereoruber TaxID=67260 RepID=UPI00363E3447
MRSEIRAVHRTIVGNRGGATALSALALTVLLSACGGGSADRDAPGAPSASAPGASGAPGATSSSPRPEQSTRTTDRPPSSGGSTSIDLDAVALKDGDLAEFRLVDVPSTRSDPPGAVAPAACRVIADARRESYTSAPSALVRRYAVATSGEHLGTGTQITLAGTTESAARDLLAALRAAVTACRDGYTGDGRGTTTVTAVTPVAVGDEGVAFRTAGRGIPTEYTFVRQGSVLLRFAASSASGKAVGVPIPVVVQQVMKVRAATD